MPTIGVDKAALYKELGREYTTQEFDELCFEFGIELDEDTSESTKPEDLAQPPQLKIEIPANRYDMLCFEGIAMNLKVFLEQQKLPKWTVTAPPNGELQVLDIKPEVGIAKVFGRCTVLIWYFIDQANTRTLLWCHTARHQIHQRTIRIIHRLARQAALEPSASENIGINRNTRSRQLVAHIVRCRRVLIPDSNQGPLFIRGAAARADQVCTAEPGKGNERQGAHGVL